MKQVARAGLGVAFLSRFAVETELQAGALMAIRIEGLGSNRELKIVYRKDKHLSHAAQALIKMSKQVSEL
jgi:DNA-binding transcriptional LysR family regulator